MIARMWFGRTPQEKGDAYVPYIRATGLEGLTGTEGNRGVYILRRRDGDEEEFVVLSLWDSMDAVRGFAGPEPEKAVYYPEDWDYLAEGEPKVRHFEILDAPWGL